MSAPRESFQVGQKVHLLVTSGQLSAKRYEVVKVWQYPTTFRYLLDTGYVADHAELRAVDGPEGAPPPAARTETSPTEVE
jgi:hypothetical protein